MGWSSSVSVWGQSSTDGSLLVLWLYSSAVFCQSFQHLSFFCEAFSWTILDRSSCPLFHSGQVFHKSVCPLTVVFLPIFLNLTALFSYPVLIAFSCTTWCCCWLPYINLVHLDYARTILWSVRQHKIIKHGKLQKSESSLICVILAEGSTNALPVFTSILPSALYCPQTDTEDNYPILCKEVEAAVQSLKKRKSAGVNNIPAELVQGRGEEVITALTTVCSKIWQTMGNTVDPVLSNYTSQERQPAAVPALPNNLPHRPPKQSHFEDHTKHIEATSAEDHRWRTGRFQSRKEHHRAGLQPWNPLCSSKTSTMSS